MWLRESNKQLSIKCNYWRGRDRNSRPAGCRVQNWLSRYCRGASWVSYSIARCRVESRETMSYFVRKPLSRELVEFFTCTLKRTSMLHLERKMYIRSTVSSLPTTISTPRWIFWKVKRSLNTIVPARDNRNKLVVCVIGFLWKFWHLCYLNSHENKY